MGQLFVPQGEVLKKIEDQNQIVPQSVIHQKNSLKKECLHPFIAQLKDSIYFQCIVPVLILPQEFECKRCIILKLLNDAVKSNQICFPHFLKEVDIFNLFVSEVTRHFIYERGDIADHYPYINFAKLPLLKRFKTHRS